MGQVGAVVKFELFHNRRAPKTSTHRPELIAGFKNAISNAASQGREPKQCSTACTALTGSERNVFEFTVQVHRRNTRKLAAFWKKSNYK
jgi:hypothetical protein